MKRVIVTGGTGFVGRALVDELRNRYPSADIIPVGTQVADIADETAWFDWLAGQGAADHIIHLAALYKAGDWPVHHPATQFNANLKINVNALEGWRRFQPQAKFTSVLSYCMYPASDNAHPEEELYGHEPEDYLFAYALTKKALLVGQRAYAQEHGLKSASAVLPTVYGPGDSFAENSHVVGALIGKFVRAARSGAPEVEVWGDGSAEREFLYLADAVDGIIRVALDSDEPALNLGTGEAYPIRDLVAQIRAGSGYAGETRYNADRFVGVRSRRLDVTRIHGVLGWSAGTSLNDGIARTIAWYRDCLDHGAEQPVDG